MVKGVNKTVIEVNNTGSKVFDKIVFYVSPSCANLSAKSLNKAIRGFTFQLDERAGRGYKSLRKRCMTRRRIIFGVGALLALGIATLITALIL
ncbi:MAG: hypothetical protein Q4B40_02195 [Clostridia bacterium]|nr:hypothetical protein [Clostridia bacterium]